MLKINGTHGAVYLTDSVLARVVGCEAMSCYGVAGMSSQSANDTVSSLLKWDNMEKGVVVKCEKNQLSVSLHIIVTFGVNIPAITQAIDEKVRYGVEKFTGMKVRRVDVLIDSIKA